MNRSRSGVLIVSFAVAVTIFASAQEGAGVLGPDAIKKVVPATYFFRGQSAPVQLRNSAGFRSADGMFTLAGLVDTSGYASDIQQKYQGFLITEVKISIEGTSVAPGAYGFGFEKDGNFLIMDVGAHDLASVPFHTDAKMTRAVPLKVEADPGGGYRLYAGKKWVTLKAQ